MENNYIIQTLLFPKSKYSVDDVKNYLLENKFKNNKLDITNNYIRARQRDPRYLKRKGYDNVKTIISKKTLIQKIVFYKAEGSNGTEGVPIMY